MAKITHLFFDLGGVCLTNAWDHISRELAAKQFRYDFESSEIRHKTLFEDFETGKISLDRYLDEVIFYQDREFSKNEFVEFLKTQSAAHQSSLDIVKSLAVEKKYCLSTLNNESLELNQFRIDKFGLKQYFTNFFSSCFLGLTKPHSEIYKKVLLITQTAGEQCLFIDDRENNTKAAAECGFQVLHLEKVSGLERELMTRKII
ncbi:MAG: HAD-IA family hydrolase [Acidobacteria bacterium]|jgi:putative hydrolase of the HAD superfamily|nr:HAD-IA family hydrolase [Acidobacteriota bacterium]